MVSYTYLRSQSSFSMIFINFREDKEVGFDDRSFVGKGHIEMSILPVLLDQLDGSILS